MRCHPHTFLGLILSSAWIASAQVCYYGPGADYKGPDTLVPCLDGQSSTCCLLGDTCLSGNACYNAATGNVYQYGCTDINFQDSTCPYKCGWNYTRSPWTALEFCNDLSGVTDTWVCDAPESCGCEWNATYGLLSLGEPRGCQQMGDDARVALYAPAALAPWVSLPSSSGGSTGYYSTIAISGTTSWISTAVSGYTPSSIGPLATYSRSAPTMVVQLAPNLTPAPSTWPAATSISGSGSGTVPAPTYTSSSTASSSPASVSSSGAPSSGAPSSGAPSSGAPSSGAPSSDAPSSDAPSSGVSVSSSSSFSSYPSTTFSTSSVGSPAASSSTSQTPGGLSTGAKAGIGVGVALGVVLLGAIAGLLLFRRRRSKVAKVAPEISQNQAPHDPNWSEGAPGAYYNPHPDKTAAWQGHSPHGSTQYGSPPMMYEFPGSDVHEADAGRGVQKPVEMPADTGAREIDTIAPTDEGMPVPKYTSPGSSPRL